MDEVVADAGKLRQWRMECFAQSAVECLARCLPGAATYRLGNWIGCLAWYLLPTRRRIVIRNLRIVCGDRCGHQEIVRLAKENFRKTGANLISVAHTAGLTQEELKQVMRMENVHLIERSLQRGKGVVLLVSHMGNWEMLSRIVHFLPTGTQVGAFYRPLNNPLLDRRVRLRREADGIRMFSKRDSALQVASFLRDGAVVGILADQRVGPTGELVEFFGRRTRGSALPSLMARRGRSDLIALSLRAESPGKWVAVLELVDEPGRAPECMHAIECAMKHSLEDVFWLQDRWKVYPNVEGGFEGWLPREAGRSMKPHRGLVWLEEAVPERIMEMLEAWLHPDLDLEFALGPNVEMPVLDGIKRVVHRVGRVSNKRELVRELVRVDEAERLPLDLVLAPAGGSGMLRKAARQVQASYFELT